MVRFLIISAVVGLLSAGLIYILSRGHVYEPQELFYGVTFSAGQAESLGLDWRETFHAVLYDLKVPRLRLSAYWNKIEPRPGEYNWDELDWQVKEAAAAGADVILAIGGRLPRWPECHFPEWATKLNAAEREQALLSYIREAVLRYHGETNISAWQVENEPFLTHFGECPKLNAAFLDQEIALVRSLDDRPVVVTDSGELSFWLGAARRADIFGTTMYRDTYSETLKRYVHYPITPAFFRLKKNIVSLFARPAKWIVIELQAEPWCPIPYQQADRAERERTMSPEKFRAMAEFARKTGFREFYLWGAEYWYWEKVVNGEGGMWEEAGSLFGVGVEDGQ